MSILPCAWTDRGDIVRCGSGRLDVLWVEDVVDVAFVICLGLGSMVVDPLAVGDILDSSKRVSLFRWRAAAVGGHRTFAHCTA